MAIIKYHIGQERDIVKETGDFENSIFTSQYHRAMSLLTAHIHNIDSTSLKIISFCGDRGEGKTSCMMSVIEILKAFNEKKHSTTRTTFPIRLNETEYETLSHSYYSVLPLIDPAFFDESHNVLEIVVGQMYRQIFIRRETSYERQSLQKLEKSFQKVKQSLNIFSSNRAVGLNDLMELGSLASAINLKTELEELVENYLKVVDKNVLIIPIDDIDLSMEYAYEMCEQIRKYLRVKKCVVMTCVKIAQLQETIALEFHDTLKLNYALDQNEANDEALVMAKKYVDKLLPVSNRIDMPKAYTLGNVKIEIYDENGLIDEKNDLKTGILELVFNRTRYLFYNPVGGITPLIPNNLRELFNLVGLLATMPPVNNSKTEVGKVPLTENKKLFKQYFYTVWKERFQSERKKRVDELINFDFGTSLNRQVLSLLVELFKPRLQKDYDSIPDVGDLEENNPKTKADNDKVSYANALINGLISDKNFGYNVTVGDVFYIFSLLEKETLAEEDYALVFFLKSFYSINLYEAYEFITENAGMVYPEPITAAARGLTMIDHRFDHANRLQQLVGGSYFTYCPGDLLPNNQDLKIIKGDQFNALIREIRDGIDKAIEIENITPAHRSPEEEEYLKAFCLNLQMCEFLMLVTKCAVRMKHEADYKKSVEELLTSMRQNVEALHYRGFYPSTGYYLLDVMAPFANIINVEFAYKRFSSIDDDLYKKIFAFPGSLIYQMMEESAKERDHIVYKTDNDRERLHRLLSDGVIRNGEVLTAIKENIISGYRRRQGNQNSMLEGFYDAIQRSEMATHKINEDKDKGPYLITFHFLIPIQKLVGRLMAENSEGFEEPIKRRFKVLFGLVKEKENKNKEEPLTIERIRKTIGGAQKGKTILKNLSNLECLPEDEKLLNSIRDIFDESKDHKFTKYQIQGILEGEFESYRGIRMSNDLSSQIVLVEPVEGIEPDIPHNVYEDENTSEIS